MPARFPGSAGELAAYGAVILSDIGANSLLLAPQTFERSQPAPDRLAAVEQYTGRGGGLLMIGGYLSFAGIEGKARYHGTPVELALPVLISATDDRVERPQGVPPAGRAGSPGAARRPWAIAGAARLQPGDVAAGSGGRGPLRRGSAAGLLAIPGRPQRGLHLRLRAALGPAGVPRLARLRHPVAQPAPLAGQRPRLSNRPAPLAGLPGYPAP